MKVHVNLDARRPAYGLDSVKGLWRRFVEGRNTLKEMRERMGYATYRGELAVPYDRLAVLSDSDLSHLRTLVSLLGTELARKVCGVPETSRLWSKLFPNANTTNTPNDTTCSQGAIPGHPGNSDAIPTDIVPGDCVCGSATGTECHEHPDIKRPDCPCETPDQGHPADI